MKQKTRDAIACVLFTAMNGERILILDQDGELSSGKWTVLRRGDLFHFRMDGNLVDTRSYDGIRTGLDNLKNRRRTENE